MRVTVLGGSAAGPAAGVGCSGYLVRDGETALVLDLGPGTLLELLKHVSEDAISAIVLSHMHQDHWLDIIPFRYRLKYGPNTPTRPIPLHIPPGARVMLDAVARALEPEQDASVFYNDVFSISEYAPDKGVRVEDLPLRFAPCNHSLPCWMKRVIHSRGDVGYTADTGPNPAAASFLQNVRCLLVEATQLEPAASESHLNALQAGELARDANADETVLSHLWRQLGPARILEEARRAYSGPLRLASPGVTLDWR